MNNFQGELSVLEDEETWLGGREREMERARLTSGSPMEVEKD